MRKWALRVLALGAISLAIPLLVAPFHTSYSETTGEGFVQFKARPAVDAAKAVREYGDSVHVVSLENLDRFPMVKDRLTFINSSNQEAWIGKDFDQWAALQSEEWGGPRDLRLVSFRGSLIVVESQFGEPESPGAEKPRMAQFRYLGDLPDKDLPIITPDELAGLPDGQFALRRADGDPLGIPEEAWDEFTDGMFTDDNPAQAFSYNGQHYQTGYEWVEETAEVTVAGLQTGLRVTGLLLLALGVYCFRNLYSLGRGVAVNPRWVAVLWDGIVLPFTMLAGFLTADAAVAKLFSVAPLVDDSFGTFMGIFFFVFSLPVVAAYTTRFTVQTIRADAEGIHIEGAGGGDFIRWDDLCEIGFSDEYVAVVRAGFPLPRKLQRRLSLESRNGRKVLINEPQVRSAKDAVANELLRGAPEGWKAKVRERLREW